MPSSIDQGQQPIARDPWRQSLRASRERRAAAFRRRRRRMRGRTGAAVALLSLTVLAGGALAAPAGPATDSGSLRTGATGTTVTKLQRALKIPADGIYGPQTRAAVRRYQRAHGLPVDGVAGPDTLRALGLTAAAKPAKPAATAEPEADLASSAATTGPPVAGGSSTATAASAGGAAVGADPAPDAPADTTPSSSTSALLQKIAQCESGGDPTAVSPDGRYRGKYQFSRSTWGAMGGSGDPAAAPETEQDRRAELLLARAGRSAWPVCGA